MHVVLGEIILPALLRWSSPDREPGGGRSGYLRRPASPEPYVERQRGMRSNAHSATFAAAMRIKQRSIHQGRGGGGGEP